MENDPTLLTPEEEAYFENRGVVEAQDEAPVEEAAEETVEDAAEETTPAKEPQAPRLVPLEALQEERRERQALARQVQEREQQFNKLQSRLDTLQEVLQPKAPPPNYDEDPIGAINHKLDETTKVYQDLQKAEQNRQAEASAIRQMEAIREYGKRHGDEYAAKQPDFWDAYTAVREAKANELRAMGYADEDQIRVWVNDYEIQMLQKAAQEKANPAERLYTMAKALGYTPKQIASAEKKLESVAAGQSVSKSLSSAGGSAPAAKMTLAALDKMSDEEFARATADPEVWRRLNLGG